MKNRRKTRVVQVGKVGIGGENPIRIQSMTTSDTRNALETALQIMKLRDSGADLARITVQGKKEAIACEEIKNILVQKGVDIPLIADIHFYPPAAMLVADFVDKVRINPGNFVDKRASFKKFIYSDESYAEELLKIEETFCPLVLKCKERGVAMRIGTNHGSLSDRIMNRFGDTPRGMCESAIEFAKVARKYDYHNFLFSMKASNPLIMIEAYRLLVAEMDRLGWDYPLHLGVTEAGEGEDGRIKSAVGIGSLLLDGIGDTIRVSLTEDPWLEIDPCKRLVRLFEEHEKKEHRLGRLSRRREKIKGVFPFHEEGSVFLFAREGDSLDGTEADAIVIEEKRPLITDKPVVSLNDLGEGVHLFSNRPDTWKQKTKPAFILLELTTNPIQEGRAFFTEMGDSLKGVPVILLARYSLEESDLSIVVGAELGALLSDGLGDGICIDANIPLEKRELLSFRILQASRMRFSKAEFIACPGCGRTLFGLQEVVLTIKEETKHLAGVKIAVMGCIVNGPGEMADADFGYVGSRTGMIDLYVGKTCVEKNIPETQAVAHLINLIKKEGKWIQPAVLTNSIS